MQKYLKIKYIISLSILIIFFGCDKEEPPKIKYSVLKKSDISFGNVTRIQYKVRVPSKVTKDDLSSVCNHLINLQIKEKDVNALAFLFYATGTGIDGPYTAGKADWCPNGKWEDADKVSTGDYSKHKLVVSVGSVLGKYTEKEESNLPENTRKKIFYDLVAKQDQGTDAMKAYDFIAKKYKVDAKIVKKIALEGIKKNWPMPN